MDPLSDPTAPVPGLLTSGGPPADPDAGMVKGTNVPVAIAKQFIRAYEPDQRWGYLSAWGLDNKGGLTGKEPVDAYGFPTAEAYPGAPVGNVYGGKWSGLNSTAAGMYQVPRATWVDAVTGLRNEGVNVTNFFSPQDQEHVGGWLLRNNGMRDWLPYNAELKKAWDAYQRTGKMPVLQQPRTGLLAQQ